MVDVHAFLVKHLTGEWRTTSACADPLGLVDMKAFDWSDEVLGHVGLDREHLCELYPPGAVMGELRADVAEEVGLPREFPSSAAPVLASRQALAPTSLSRGART